MNCENCCYFWKEENEERACCHWISRCPDDEAPCEYDDTGYSRNPLYDIMDDDDDDVE